jgi:hypothetical protein
MKKLSAMVLLLVLPVRGYCGASSFGELAGAELSVRANGMANVGVATEGDIFGVFYNPAIIVNSRQLGMTFQRGYCDDSTGGFSLSFPHLAGKNLNSGFSGLYYTAGSMDMYTSDNVLKSVDAEQDYLIAASLSGTLGMISVGGSAKLLNTRLFDAVQGSALMFDAGVIARCRLATVGLAVQNLGGKMMLGDEYEYVPVTYRAGVNHGFVVADLKTSGAFDIVKTGDELPFVRFGVEFMNSASLAFRAGYEHGLNRAISSTDGICAGIGFSFNGVTVDYAYVPYQLLGATHRIAVIYHY